MAPLLNANDGARFDWKRSLQFGTVAFWRPQKADGTIGSNGALAYSNANNFITDARGAHLGHELVHTFQYRRDTMMGPNISSMNSRFARALGDRFVDDTAWSIDWGLQCFWSDLKFQDKDFDIPMEREAYFISGKSN